MQSMNSFISGHNKKILSPSPEVELEGYNCTVRMCMLDGHCKTKNMVYRAMVNSSEGENTCETTQVKSSALAVLNVTKNSNLGNISDTTPERNATPAPSAEKDSKDGFQMPKLWWKGMVGKYLVG